jgi:hypothetical protein
LTGLSDREGLHPKKSQVLVAKTADKTKKNKKSFEGAPGKELQERELLAKERKKQEGGQMS